MIKSKNIKLFFIYNFLFVKFSHSMFVNVRLIILLYLGMFGFGEKYNWRLSTVLCFWRQTILFGMLFLHFIPYYSLKPVLDQSKASKKI